MTCNCMGKAKDCTCKGRCRCECTCQKDTQVFEFEDFDSGLFDTEDEQPKTDNE